MLKQKEPVDFGFQSLIESYVTVDRNFLSRFQPQTRLDVVARAIAPTSLLVNFAAISILNCFIYCTGQMQKAKRTFQAVW